VLPLPGSGRVLLAGIQESQRASLEEGFRRLAGETEYTADFINLSYGRNMPGSVSGYDAVIVTSWLNNMSQFDPAESVMIPQIQSLIQQAHAAGVPCIVISTELPYDLSCYEGADALLAVYNPVGLRYSESGAVTGAVGPNIPAALDIIFGHCGPSASLPVNIPRVEGTGFTDEIVYPRGTGITW
jgi:beta-N-acetylhexosaminidase